MAWVRSRVQIPSGPPYPLRRQYALRYCNAPKAQDSTTCCFALSAVPERKISSTSNSRAGIAFTSPLLANTKAENALMFLFSEPSASIKNSEISFLLRKRELNASPLTSISESSSFDIILLMVF